MPEALARVYNFTRDTVPSQPKEGLELGPFSGVVKPEARPRASTFLLDLRTVHDFREWHLPSAVNLPLETLKSHTCSPFKDSTTLERQWLEMESLFNDALAVCAPAGKLSLRNHQVMVVCYDGDTSRVATSILRAKKIDACSMRGGLREMLLRWPNILDFYAEDEGTAKMPAVPRTVSSVDVGAAA